MWRIIAVTQPAALRLCRANALAEKCDKAGRAFAERSQCLYYNQLDNKIGAEAAVLVDFICLSRVRCWRVLIAVDATSQTMHTGHIPCK